MGVNDFYRFRLDQPQKIRIQVRNAGLSIDNNILIYLYDPYCNLVDSNKGRLGTNKGASWKSIFAQFIYCKTLFHFR